jgi:ketosteroid isomerase-like protein
VDGRGTSLAVSGGASALGNKTADTEKALRTVRDQLWNAYVKKDRAIVDKILSDDYVCLHRNAQKLSKADRLKQVNDEDLSLRSFTIADSVIRIYGDIAIETCKSTWVIRNKGQDVTCEDVQTMIYRKEKSGWVVCGEQYTPIPK